MRQRRPPNHRPQQQRPQRPRRPGPSTQPSLENMRALLERAGIQLKPEALDQLWRFHRLLRERNHDRDLTRLIEFESVVVKHYIDSLYVGKLMHLPSPLVDIGTGAGFPGIPLKIRYPDLELTLAEMRPRRIAFLEEAISTLGLRKVKTFEHRVVSRSFTEPMAGVITRAVDRSAGPCCAPRAARARVVRSSS